MPPKRSLIVSLIQHQQDRISGTDSGQSPQQEAGAQTPGAVVPLGVYEPNSRV